MNFSLLKIFFFCSLSYMGSTFVKGQSDTLTASEIFVLLPDSVFNKQHSPFSKENPLTMKKRRSLLSLGDSILKNGSVKT